MKYDKAKYLLIGIMILAILSFLSFKQIVLFKPSGTIVKVQNTQDPLQVNPQTRPEEVIKIFLTNLNQSELLKAWDLLTKSLQKSVEDTNPGNSNMLYKILNAVKIENPEYTSVEVINNGFTDGVYKMDLKLIYPNDIVVRSLKMIIEDEIWKIKEVTDVETLKATDTQAVNSWKTLKNTLFEIKYPQNWIINKNIPEDTIIQNISKSLDKVSDYPAGAAKIQINILKSDPEKPINSVISCESIPNFSCKYVYLNGQIFKELKANTGSTSKITFIYVGNSTDKDVLITSAVNVENQPEMENMLKSVVSTFKML